MALNTAISRISTNTDTAVVAAPTTARIWVRSITVSVEIAGTSSLLRVEDGAGGNVLLAVDTSATTARPVHVVFPLDDAGLPGFPLTAATALNVETSGSAAATVNVAVTYSERG